MSDLEVLAASLLVLGSLIALYAIATFSGDSEDLGRVSAKTLARIRKSSDDESTAVHQAARISAVERRESV